MKEKDTDNISFQKLASHSVPKASRARNGVVEIFTGTRPTLDVRFLCVAIEYAYMFERPAGELTIDRRWATAFSQTCAEIDAVLGDSTHGFCWRLIDIYQGEPSWMWSLAQEYNHRVLVTRGANGPQVTLAAPALDPLDRLRNTIQEIIDRGRCRAMAASLAANDPQYGRGGAQ